MSDSAFLNENVTTVVRHPNWGAIWAGVFTFFAIWSVFGLLGMSIFASVTSVSTASTNVGMGIWAVVLTIVAMFVAGRVTGHLAGIGNSRDGVIHGMIMFGLSVIAALAISGLGANGVNATTQFGVHGPYLLGVFADLGWFGFLSLFLGWLAAMGGASAAAAHALHTSSHSQQLSHGHA